MRTLSFSVTEDYDDRKVLHFLRGSAGLSTKLIRRLKTIENGILLNGQHARTIDLIHTGDTLTVNLPEDRNMVSSEGFNPDALEILYEDDDLIAVNKPADLAIHPSHNHQGDTLANLLAAHLAKEGKQAVFRAVGRLDKGTSGIVVCALNAYAAARLQARIDKTYYAIPSGRYEGSGTIDAPIYRPDPIKTIRTVDPRGDHAVTHWTALATGETESLVEVKLETGRTHQIRVHFASLGTPLVGDYLYGTPIPEMQHQALHCGKASFLHPYTGQKICLEAPFPADFVALLEHLKSPDVVSKINPITK